MKAIHILLFSLIFSNVFSQEFPEKEIKTEVSEVTVFLDGAQVVRKKTVDLTKGKAIIKFVNLSPFIDAKSIQVKAQGELTVLSVNHQHNFLQKNIESDELTDLGKRLETVEDKINIENTHLSIIKENLVFLHENRVIGGRNDQVSITNLQQVSDFYNNKLTSLKMKEIESNKALKTLNDQKSDLRNQINTLTNKKGYPTGEILVKVEAKQTDKFTLELTYLVGNAGWFPSYDIRAKNITEPVQLIYKANVRQDTKVDWSNVKLKFSSANPNVSGVAPELQTYILNYNVLPPAYNKFSNNIRGKVVGSDGFPIPFCNVMVVGTTIGATTDSDGNYSITIPNNSSQLAFSYVGYQQQTLPISSQVMNVVLQESMVELESVVLSQGKIKKEDTKIGGVMPDKQNSGIRGTNSLAIPMTQVENQTTVDFEIKTPYTIKSENKNYSVDMDFYDLPAVYQYYSVPKIDKDAFLIANIVDWEKYNLLEGEANVFFENTYVGKTLLDVRFASDTLAISLGRDKKVSVNREKIKDLTTRQFIGSKKEETRAWKTTVRNNKNQNIQMIILDQVPVSTTEEIEVAVQNKSGAKQNPETGEIKWEIELKPNEKKELELKYSVKYPKNRNLIVE